jgi:hypothetical protein
MCYSPSCCSIFIFARLSRPPYVRAGFHRELEVQPNIAFVLSNPRNALLMRMPMASCSSTQVAAARHNWLSSLESALPKNTRVTPLQSALPNSLDLKSFRIRTCKTGWGVGKTVNQICPGFVRSFRKRPTKGSRSHGGRISEV